MQAVDVAVIGGGPAGLATAHSLLAARPALKVAVMERSDMRPRGAVVFMVPNGTRAIEAIGGPELKGKLARHHTKHMKTRSFSPSGELINSSDDGGIIAKLQAQDGGERIFIPWHTLQSELADALPAGIVRTRHRFLGYTETADGVVAEFDTPDGVQRVAASLLVGCDGGQSMVREQLLGDGPPKYMGMAVWRAIRPRPADWPVDQGYVGFGGMAKASALTHTIGDGSTMAWQAFAPWPAEQLDAIGGGRRAYIQDNTDMGVEATRSRDVKAGKERIARALAAFEGYPEALTNLIATTDPSVVTEHGQMFREHDDCQVYARGRIALVGDAAHLATPFLGQGTSQAIEDALELGRAVGAHGPTPEALAEYERVRVPLSGAVQETSVQMFKDFLAGKPRDKTEFEVNAEKGFTKRTFEPLAAVAAVAS